MDFSKFVNPDNYYRPAPFWAINDRITPDESAHQLAEMRRVGLSGGFFHSRSGLITEYMGEEWFTAMRAVLQAANECDGYVWLYDEDLWPSGTAAGQVSALNDAFRSAALHATLLSPGEEIHEDDADTKFKVCFIIQREGMNLLAAERIDEETARRRTDMERLLITRVYAAKMPWWSNNSWGNTLDHDAMQRFMQLTHEKYYAELGDEFGKRIPGMFTDEPAPTWDSWCKNKNGIGWYEGMPERYRDWHGRDWWADIPYLFFDGPPCRKIRLLMQRTVQRQFCEAFTKPISEWCERRGIAFTGHFMDEDTLQSQARTHYGGVMMHYRYQQIPGVDHLCRRIDEGLLTLKQASSAARQLGRKQVLSELFGIVRHTSTFKDYKWIGDYHLALGVNFFCPHLSLYSARGRRKRDYPPNLNYQQSFWSELKPLNDYFTRVGYALTCGNAKAEVLLLHPVETGVADRRFALKTVDGIIDEDLSTAARLDIQFRRTLESILNAGYECDLGDEWFIEEMGSVAGDIFRIGEMAYSMVVVPPSRTWRPATFALLRQFVQNGGKVIFVGETPTEVDTDPNAAGWRALVTQAAVVPAARVQIQQAMYSLVPAAFRLVTSDGLAPTRTFTHHRVDGEQQFFFIVNSDLHRAQDYLFTTQNAAGKQLAVWHPIDGTRQALSTVLIDGGQQYRFTLPGAGSILLVLGADAAGDAPLADAMPDLAAGTVMRLPDDWRYERSDGNVLVLDRLSASVDGGATWLGPDLEFRMRRWLADYFGITDSLVWQPWAVVKSGVFDHKGGDVILRYQFNNAARKTGRVSLVIEDLTKGNISVNGTTVDISASDWQWDKGFGKIDITDQVIAGINDIQYRTDYNFLTEIEQAYLVGDFGVKLCNPYAGEICDEPAEIRTGSLVGQMHPFYSGKIVYRTVFTAAQTSHLRYFLRLCRPSGILYHVRVNGRAANSIYWQPFVTELTSAICAGENTLEIEVVTSCQNTLGPLHEREGDDFISSPYAFEGEDAIREEFSLFDYGLLDGAEIVVI